MKFLHDVRMGLSRSIFFYSNRRPPYFNGDPFQESMLSRASCAIWISWAVLAFLVPVQSAAAANQWEDEVMSSCTLACFFFHSDYRLAVFTGDFSIDILQSRGIARDIPGTTVRHVSEIFGPELEEDDNEYVSDTESTRTSSLSPSRRLRDAQEQGRDD